MISRIETQSSAAASFSLNQNKRIQEMHGKIELNASGLVSLRQDTTEHLQTSVSNLQTDMLSRIDTERTAAASIHSNYDEKINGGAWQNRIKRSGYSESATRND